MDKNKSVIIIAGPYGSGKTTVAKILAECTGFNFFDLESFYKSLFPSRTELWKNKELAIKAFISEFKKTMDCCDRPMIVGQLLVYYDDFYLYCKNHYNCHLVFLNTLKEICVYRVMQRNVNTKKFKKGKVDVEECHDLFVKKIKPLYTPCLEITNNSTYEDLEQKIKTLNKTYIHMFKNDVRADLKCKKSPELKM